MKKRLLVLGGVILLVMGCYLPTKIKSPKHLFQDVAANYNLSEYNLVLRTRDSIFYLSDASLMPDGRISAKVRERPVKGKDTGIRIDIITRQQSNKILNPVLDSTKQNGDRIIINNEKIKSIRIVRPRLHRLDSKKLLYERNWFLKNGILLICYLCWAFVIYGAVIMIIIMVEFLNDPSSFCYIATMVYGSYDAPEVLVLRKYRDEKLAPYFLGRIFIGIYYTVSPVFVKVFKNNIPVNRFIKSILDRWVSKLKAKEMIIENDN